MARMTDKQLADFLGGTDHRGTAVLAVSRVDRGPLTVPLAFHWDGAAFRFQTKKSRHHAREFMRTGRATVMVHHEDYRDGQYERYVVAEGSVRFEDEVDDPDRFQTAVLTPDSLVAVVFQD